MTVFIRTIFLIAGLSMMARASDVRVAAASDLNFAIKEIIANFETQTGNKVKLTLGSSGNFYAQIANGAPFEVFLSADLDYPRQLENRGLAERGSTFTYAVGKIAIWVPGGSSIDPRKTEMQSLLDPSVRKIAIANPLHAPYGKAAVAAMKQAGVYEAVKSKLVFGENISQAAQFVQSGAADIGVIALSLVRNNEAKYWEVPSGMYPRMEQGAVLVKGAGPSARAFHEWLRRPDSRQILSRSGFGLP